MAEIDRRSSVRREKSPPKEVCNFEQTRLRTRLYSLLDRNLGKKRGICLIHQTTLACSGVGFTPIRPSDQGAFFFIRVPRLFSCAIGDPIRTPTHLAASPLWATT